MPASLASSDPLSTPSPSPPPSKSTTTNVTEAHNEPQLSLHAAPHHAGAPSDVNANHKPVEMNSKGMSFARLVVLNDTRIDPLHVATGSSLLRLRALKVTLLLLPIHIQHQHRPQRQRQIEHNRAQLETQSLSPSVVPPTDDDPSTPAGKQAAGYSGSELSDLTDEEDVAPSRIKSPPNPSSAATMSAPELAHKAGSTATSSSIAASVVSSSNDTIPVDVAGDRDRDRDATKRKAKKRRSLIPEPPWDWAYKNMKTKDGSNIPNPFDPKNSEPPTHRRSSSSASFNKPSSSRIAAGTRTNSYGHIQRAKSTFDEHDEEEEEEEEEEVERGKPKPMEEEEDEDGAHHQSAHSLERSLSPFQLSSGSSSSTTAKADPPYNPSSDPPSPIPRRRGKAPSRRGIKATRLPSSIASSSSRSASPDVNAHKDRDGDVEMGDAVAKADEIADVAMAERDSPSPPSPLTPSTSKPTSNHNIASRAPSPHPEVPPIPSGGGNLPGEPSIPMTVPPTEPTPTAPNANPTLATNPKPNPSPTTHSNPNPTPNSDTPPDPDPAAQLASLAAASQNKEISPSALDLLINAAPLVVSPPVPPPILNAAPAVSAAVTVTDSSTRDAEMLLGIAAGGGRTAGAGGAAAAAAPGAGGEQEAEGVEEGEVDEGEDGDGDGDDGDGNGDEDGDGDGKDDGNEDEKDDEEPEDEDEDPEAEDEEPDPEGEEEVDPDEEEDVEEEDADVEEPVVSATGTVTPGGPAKFMPMPQDSTAPSPAQVAPIAAVAAASSIMAGSEVIPELDPEGDVEGADEPEAEPEAERDVEMEVPSEGEAEVEETEVRGRAGGTSKTKRGKGRGGRGRGGRGRGGRSAAAAAKTTTTRRMGLGTGYEDAEEEREKEGEDEMDVDEVGAEGEEPVEVEVEQEEEAEAEAEMERDTELQPHHRAEALDVLAQIELKFALLREKVYVEKMEALAWEEAMVEADNHPELQHLRAELENRRNKRLELAARRKELEIQNTLKRRRANEDAVWSWWHNAKGELQTEMIAEANRKRRKLERERRAAETPPSMHRMPERPLQVPIAPSFYEIVQAQSNSNHPHQLTPDGLHPHSRVPPQPLVFPSLSSLPPDVIHHDLQAIFYASQRAYELHRPLPMNPGPPSGGGSLSAGLYGPIPANPHEVMPIGYLGGPPSGPGPMMDGFGGGPTRSIGPRERDRDRDREALSMGMGLGVGASGGGPSSSLNGRRGQPGGPPPMGPGSHMLDGPPPPMGGLPPLGGGPSTNGHGHGYVVGPGGPGMMGSRSISPVHVMGGGSKLNGWGAGPSAAAREREREMENRRRDDEFYRLERERHERDREQRERERERDRMDRIERERLERERVMDMQFRMGPGSQGSSASAAAGAPAGHHHHHHHHHHHIVHRHHPQSSTPNGLGVGGPASRPMSPLSQAQAQAQSLSQSQHSSQPQSAQLSPRIPHPPHSAHEAPEPPRPHSGSSTTEIININPNTRQPLWRPEDGKRLVKESAAAPPSGPGGSNILGPHERLMTPFVMTPAQAHQHQVNHQAQNRSATQSRRSSFNGNGGPVVVNEIQSYSTSPPEPPRRSSLGGPGSNATPMPMPAPAPVSRQPSPASSRNTRLLPPPSPSTSSTGRPGTAGATTPLTPFGPPPPPHMVNKGLGSSSSISPTSKMAVSTISPALPKIHGPSPPPTKMMILDGMPNATATSGPAVSSTSSSMSPTTTATVMTGPGVAPAPAPVTLPPLNVNVQNAHVDSPLSAPTPSTRPQGSAPRVSPGGVQSGSEPGQAPFLPAPTPLSMMVPRAGSIQTDVPGSAGSNGANGLVGSGTPTPVPAPVSAAGVKVGDA